MITSVHTLIYSDDPSATRAFLKDVLRWPFVNDDDSIDPADWLIFGTGRSELGVHPIGGAQPDPATAMPRHEITLMCDDIAGTMTELALRGAEFRGDAENMGFGVGVQMAVPGADDLLLYQPHHQPAFQL